MKKLNFKQLRVETSIDNFEYIDVTKDLGNFLFQSAKDLEIDALSRQIYSSTGEIEIEDSTYEKMISLLEDNVTFRVMKSIKEQANKNSSITTE